MTAQRSLDRCVYSFLSQKCATLTELSESNHRLRQIADVVAAAEASAIVAAPIPGLDAVVAAAAEATIQAMLPVARAIAKYQDIRLGLLKATWLAGQIRLWNCGFPTSGFAPPRISRPETTQSLVTSAPAPLEWSESAKGAEVALRGRDLRVQSFAHCSRQMPGDVSAGVTLDGEHYRIRFEHAQ